MKMCQAHWSALKTAINGVGLAHLVTNSKEELEKRIAPALARQDDVIDGKSDDRIRPEEFEPLFYAHNNIAANAVICGGNYLLTGDYCPLCELEKNKASMGEGADDWIKKAAEGALICAKDLGLVSKQ